MKKVVSATKSITSGIIIVAIAAAILADFFGLFFGVGQQANANPDTETLRPNGAGSETSGFILQNPGTGEHYDKVDEETADDNTTYVYASLYSAGGAWNRDLYALPAHTGSGTINSVTVYARLKDTYGSFSSGKISIRTNSTTYDTSAYALTTSWATKSNTWTTNPQTSSAWTWDEIDALEVGVSLYNLQEMGGGSILKGQPVLMADGSQKNIEDIEVGDEVISFDLSSKAIVKDRVITVKQGRHDDYLFFNGALKTSLEHLIWANGEFKPAEEIKVGDSLLDLGGNKISVTKKEYIQEKVDTYDLIIEKNHNFFANSYLVHNQSSQQGFATQVYAEVDYTPLAVGMASTNYKIKADSINSGGMDNQTSTSGYKMQESIGEIGTGELASTNYKLKAGYRHLISSYSLSVSSPSDITMSPSIPGITGGTSNGSAAWNVTTDDPAGYAMTIAASTSPALAGSTQGDSFADYTPTNSTTPDYTWSVSDSTAEFGFTPEGSHITQKFKDNGADTCDTGSNDTTNKCWYKFSTSAETIASSTSATHPSGTSTTVKVQAQLYNSDGVPNNDAGQAVEDTYQAVITVTVTTQ